MTDKDLEDAMEKFDNNDIVGKANKQHFTRDALLPAITGGILASVFGASIWGFFALFTGHELLGLSCIVGGLSGIGVVLFSKSKRIISLQIISVFSTIFGILVVKYTFSYYMLVMPHKKDGGIEVINNVSMFSIDFMTHFTKGITETLFSSDIIIIIFALFIAWIIPKCVFTK